YIQSVFEDPDGYLRLAKMLDELILQHPDEPWLAFVRDLPPIARPRVGLFTTYQLLTGSMFPKMRAALAGKTPAPVLELKSRDSRLSERDRDALTRFVAGG
ncbi:MAG TPA: hypothetical protein VIU37_06530, partial [Candidatus Limnocylindrales bacterium]